MDCNYNTLNKLKCAEFHIGTKKIEFMNSILGIESVILNGNKVSNKFSIFGTSHNFTRNSSVLTLKSKYRQFYKNEIQLELEENEKLIETITVLADKKQRIYTMVFGLALGIGIFKFLDFII